MQIDPRPIMPGDRVRVWDRRSKNNLPATVVSRYGSWTISYVNVCYNDYGQQYGEPDIWLYPDLVAVKFDHRDGVSRGHFTNGVEVIEYKGQRLWD